MNKNTEHILDITALSTEGKGISRLENNFVIFVTHALPGDKVLARITRKKSRYAEASLIEIINPSPDRINPECIYFGTCGGCKLQNYKYENQLSFKKQTIIDALGKIGGFHPVEVPDPLKSDRQFFYRNKMEFSFSDDKWFEKKDPEKNEQKFAVGLHVPKFHPKILDIEKCYLQSELSNSILNFTRNFFKTRNTGIYSTKTHSGYLRFLIVRQSMNTKDLMVHLITHYFDDNIMHEFSGELKSKFPEITSFVNSVSESKAQVAFAEESRTFFGNDFITEKMFPESGNRFNPVFKISPNSFFQTNTIQTAKLYSTAKEFSEFSPADRVLDLYCGAGAIAIFISQYVKKVKGVELIPDAVSNAEENIRLNDIKNISFVTSDIKEFLKQNDLSGYNKVIVDPPRSGLHPDICEILALSHFERIIYISCNPSTQARDLKIICSNNNFLIDKIQPVDMFPQTYHIENIVSLKRNG